MRGRRRWTLLAQIALVLAIVWFTIDRLRGQWDDVAATAAGLQPRWGLVLASCVVVLLTYGVLIQTWRVVVAGWGERLGYVDAARIWTVSNLGRYVPGKVWQLGAMAYLAQQRGVSGVVAAGSALVVTVIHLIAGFVVAATTGAELLGFSTPSLALIAVAMLGILFAPAVIPALVRGAAKVLGRDAETIPRLPARTVWYAVVASGIAWVMYGVAFRLLALGVLNTAPGATSLYVAVFTGSYVLGFIVLIAPAGFGVRELSMGTALANAGFAVSSAAVLVIVSRLWLTVLEVVPALAFLAHGAVRATRANVANRSSPP
jgi:glycosyltransferase 2 family protein